MRAGGGLAGVASLLAALAALAVGCSSGECAPSDAPMVSTARSVR
jgi:hypothetical protein